MKAHRSNSSSASSSLPAEGSGLLIALVRPVLAPNELAVRNAQQIRQATHEMFLVPIQPAVGKTDLPEPLDEFAPGVGRELGTQLMRELVQRMGFLLPKRGLFDQRRDFCLVELEPLDHGTLDDAPLAVVDAGIGHSQLEQKHRRCAG